MVRRGAEVELNYPVIGNYRMIPLPWIQTECAIQHAPEFDGVMNMAAEQTTRPFRAQACLTKFTTTERYPTVRSRRGNTVRWRVHQPEIIKRICWDGIAPADAAKLAATTLKSITINPNVSLPQSIHPRSGIEILIGEFIVIPAANREWHLNRTKKGNNGRGMNGRRQKDRPEVQQITGDTDEIVFEGLSNNPF